MPIFFQQDINQNTKLAIWKIEESEDFFLNVVPLQRSISHPHKRLQHLAGRYLLRYLFPHFPVGLIQIADTRKPFLKDEAFHFSISHCGDFAAAIVSTRERVGIDIEITNSKILKIAPKFLHPEEQGFIKESKENGSQNLQLLTLLWCAKEALFKWWGMGGIDFSEMLRVSGSLLEKEGSVNGRFIKEEINISLPVHYKIFAEVSLAWVNTEP